MSELLIGRLLSASTSGCMVGCQVSRSPLPAFGEMVRIPLNPQEQIFGLITNIRIEDDGLIRQLATADEVSEEVIQDNRMNRTVPVEISVLFIGYEQNGQMLHLLPPRPPLSLDKIYTCDEGEICRFSGLERIGYLRHVLAHTQDLPVADLLTAHLTRASQAQQSCGNNIWVNRAIQEVITLLRDDYSTLTGVLNALADAGLEVQEN